MQVFISWSGTKSKKIAEVLNNWLPHVIQAVQPFYSHDDIHKGNRWITDIGSKLESTNFGLIILERENLNAPWIMYEAGALSKHIDKSKVCPLLFDLKPTDIEGPLSQFQATQFNKEDMKRLLETINNAMENSLSGSSLTIAFDKWWGDLESKISDILNLTSDKEKVEIRSERELLEEILTYSRKRHFITLFRERSEYDPFLNKSESTVTYSDSDKVIRIMWKEAFDTYDIHLDQLNTSSNILDMILQIHGKGICKPRHIMDFLDCLEELSSHYFNKNAQGVFCPFGKSMSIDWTNSKYSPVK